MKYKIVDGNIAAGENGHPIVINADGKEEELRATELIQKIPVLNSEAKGHREAKEALAKEYEDFKSKFAKIEDPEQAFKALETMKGLDSKSLIDSTKANEERERILKDAHEKLENMQAEHKSKIKELETGLETAQNKVYKLMVSDKFKASPALKGTIFENAPELAESYFGKNYKVENDNVIGYLEDQQIMNPDINKLNEVAGFDDSLRIMIDKDPRSAAFRLAGSGGNNGEQGHVTSNTGTIQVTREQLSNPADYQRFQDEAAKSGVSIEVVD